MSESVSDGRSSRVSRTWRRYVEDHAIRGSWALRVLAQCTSSSPKALKVSRAASLAPRGNILVSVVIPCYNYARYLPGAVESVISQDGVDVEVVIVDDKSTDDSRAVAQALAAAHTQVRYIANAENIGHVRSFNAGWEASSGDLVVKLDADDLITGGALARAAALFELHPSIGLVYGHPWHFTDDVPPSGRVEDVKWSIWNGEDWLAERCRLGVSAITNPEMVIRSSVLTEFGAMDPTVPYAPDMELSLRIAAVRDIAYIGGADQALHREHSSSMSETDGSGVLVDLEARARAFRRAFERVGEHLSRKNQLEELWRGALAGDAFRQAISAAVQDRPQAEVARLLDFARSVQPAASSDLLDCKFPARPRRGIRRLASFVRRVVMRIRSEAYYVRWAVRGV